MPMPFVIALCLAATVADAGTEPLRFNQIQVIGTHNSYHVAPSEAAIKATGRVYAQAITWRYSHAPLDIQLDRGVRSFELDLHCTNKGYRVLHTPLVDNQSTCRWFAECLESVRDWSDVHPGHVPISFLLEIKDGAVDHSPDFLPIDGPALDRIDTEILGVFDAARIVRPDDVRGENETLEEAVLTRGWPLLDALRGRVMFILHENGANREAYLAGHPSLRGRAMFVRSEPGRPEAATLVHDRPHVAAIQELVRQGYWIRTRADAGLVEGRLGKAERSQDALASGAHIVSTDFPPGEPDPETGYVVALPGGAAARCNPVNVPDLTRDSHLLFQAPRSSHHCNPIK